MIQFFKGHTGRDEYFVINPQGGGVGKTLILA